MITIIMPVYNEDKYIEQAIKSVLKQKYNDWELIIVDDCSTDGTLKIAQEFEKKDSRIRCISEGKLGKNGACNKAYLRSRGEWFTYLAGDDLLAEGILEKWSNRIKEFSLEKKVIVQSRLKMFADDPKYKKYDGIIIPKSPKDVCKSGGIFLANRRVMEDMYPLPEQLPNEDGWSKLYFDLFLDERIKEPSVALHYRIHENNSIKKDESFDRFTEAYHERAKVTELFLQKYEKRIDNQRIEELMREILLERYRYKGRCIKILTMRKIKFSDKMRAFLLSSKLLYYVKVKLNTLLWGN